MQLPQCNSDYYAILWTKFASNVSLAIRFLSRLDTWLYHVWYYTAFRSATWPANQGSSKKLEFNGGGKAMGNQPQAVSTISCVRLHVGYITHKHAHIHRETVGVVINKGAGMLAWQFHLGWTCQRHRQSLIFDPDFTRLTWVAILYWRLRFQFCHPAV